MLLDTHLHVAKNIKSILVNIGTLLPAMRGHQGSAARINLRALATHVYDQSGGQTAG